jgi:hypothetical protein
MNFASYVISKESEFELEKNQALIDLIHEMENLNLSGEILLVMEKIHHLIKVIIGEKVLLEKLPMSSSDSHAKEIFLEYPTRHGILRFEKMHFQSRIPTILHTHPEFIMDEVMAGSFMEAIFRRKSSGEYEEWKVEKRNRGETLRIHDPAGHPHTITAMEGDCITACLYLGQNYVKAIEETISH